MKTFYEWIKQSEIDTKYGRFVEDVCNDSCFPVETKSLDVIIAHLIGHDAEEKYIKTAKKLFVEYENYKTIQESDITK